MYPVCAIDEYASIRFTFVCVIATRLPSVIVRTARMPMIGSQSALIGPSASTKTRMMTAKAPTFGPTERYPVTGVGEPWYASGVQ